MRYQCEFQVILHLDGDPMPITVWSDSLEDEIETALIMASRRFNWNLTRAEVWFDPRVEGYGWRLVCSSNERGKAKKGELKRFLSLKTAKKVKAEAKRFDRWRAGI